MHQNMQQLINWSSLMGYTGRVSIQEEWGEGGGGSVSRFPPFLTLTYIVSVQYNSYLLGTTKHVEKENSK